MALAQLGLKFKIGHHHAQLVEYFMDRATNPTYEKMAAHYPEHPRAGAPPLLPDSHLGLCVMNALNVKRGFWRVPRSSRAGHASAGVSPLDSTPGSTGASGSASAGSRGGGGVNGKTGSSVSGNGNGNTTKATKSSSGSAEHSPHYGTNTSGSGTRPSGISVPSTNDVGFMLPDIATSLPIPTVGQNTNAAKIGLPQIPDMPQARWEAILGSYNLRADGTTDVFRMDVPSDGLMSAHTGAVEERYAMGVGPEAGQQASTEASGTRTVAGTGTMDGSDPNALESGSGSGSGSLESLGAHTTFGTLHSIGNHPISSGYAVPFPDMPMPMPVPAMPNVSDLLNGLGDNAESDVRLRARAYFGMAQKDAVFPGDLPNSASWFMASGTEREYDRLPKRQ